MAFLSFLFDWHDEIDANTKSKIKAGENREKNLFFMLDVFNGYIK
jgi:hypothetical protein